MGTINKRCTNNVGRLWMRRNRKMKSTTFIHNDNVKCFHMAIQRKHKLVMMGRINFEDHALIKRRQIDEKMNVMGENVQGREKMG